MAKTVNRHLNYAWIEYGNPRDGGAFTRGLEKLGWRNLFSQLPVKTDAWGIRAQLKSHPLLPIRWRANSLLALPNERHDMPGKPFIGDPLFEAYRKANDDKKFDQAIIDQNADVATWVFSPGLRKEGEEEFHWTAGSDATDYADLVAISGHGAAGNVWGGRRTASLFLALSRAGDSASPRLKYVIVPACTNLSEMNLEGWLPAFRRKPYPLHGAFGYENSYPGDQPGQMIFQQFVTNLAAGGGAENTILEAY
ncbi:MAG: hypothetical protein FJW30_28625, partial [Acidobacteria bacterium]|nr:hypothetical protein [Acidobacteriota bacterium]